MPLLFTLIYLVMIGLTGYAALSAAFGFERKHWAWIAGFSYAGGLGIWATILFVVSIAGFPPNRFLLIAICIFTIAAICVLRFQRRLLLPNIAIESRGRWNAASILGVVAIVVIALAFANVAVEALTPGLFDIDSYAIWMLKAKIAASQPLYPVPRFLLDPSLSFTHQDYPLGFPMIVAGAYAAIGGIDAQWGKLVLLPIYASLVAVAYGALCSRVRPAHAIAITAVFVAAPALRQHAGIPVAEVLLVLMHTCTLVLLLDWMLQGGRMNLLAAAAFAVFAAFTKNEGLALLPILFLATVMFALLHHRRQLLIDSLAALVLTLILIAPWMVYRRFLPHTHEDYGGKFSSVGTITANLPRLLQILPLYLKHLLEFNTVGGIWPVLVVVAFMGWRAFSRLPVLALWFILLAHLALYAATFMVTPWQLDVLIPMVSAKLLLHVAPAAALLIALHLSTFQAESTPQLLVASPA